MPPERSPHAVEFHDLARFIAVRSDYPLGPERDAAVKRLPARVQEIIKVAVSPTTTGDPGFATYAPLATAFLESLRGLSVFDTILNGGGLRVPLNSRVVVETSAITGTTVAESHAKPIRSMTLAASDIAPRKSTAIVVATDELLKLVSADGARLFDSELRNAVAVATDAQFLATLYASVTPTASAGATTANVLTDLGALLSALTLESQSRVYVAMSPTNISKIMLKVSTNGGFAFPSASMSGGQIVPGIALLASNAVPTNAVIAIDASGIAGNSELPELRSLRHGDVQMDTAPDSPPVAGTVRSNLWQHDMRALLCERWFGFAKVRTASVSAISGATY